MGNPNIPVGISDFKEIRENNNYYIDKSGFISELLTDGAAKVTLITRPRRFGKTLGMSMLYYFFNVRNESQKLFEGLEISRNHELCEKWLNKWPTIFLTFKDIDGLDFASAYDQLVFTISDLYQKYSFLLESEEIDEEDRKRFKLLKSGEGSKILVIRSLSLLMRLLENYYHKQMILLIDEYDVPIAKASSKGYYQQMLEIIRGMMSTALKDNTSLKFAVITGCLQIAKESIFTGTNNFVTDTIANTGFNEYFGFTQQEVNKILEDTGTVQYAKQMKEWYDGYHMGEIDVYCPWDVMNYLRELQRNPKAQPVSYWKNTSDNAIIRSFIDFAGNSITDKMETLLSGGYILQDIDENLTYDYLHSSESNLWSILYMTGYLTEARISEGKTAFSPDTKALKIPNAEIREIFETMVMKWFADSVKKWNRTAIFQALWNQKPEIITREMNLLLWNTISYHDYKEDFYHAFLTGIFMGAGEQIESNKEHGLGRPDLVIIDKANGKVAIFEVKYSQSMKQLNKDCDKALAQMKERKYAEDYKDRYKDIFCYGISFYKKECLVKMLES